jgi:hypothetical protein
VSCSSCLAGRDFTILSPCILPVPPFVFARSDQPFVRSGLPILLGMAVTFAIVASLAAVGGGWVVEANHYGRLAAILLVGLFGITLLVPGVLRAAHAACRSIGLWAIAEGRRYPERGDIWLFSGPRRGHGNAVGPLYRSDSGVVAHRHSPEWRESRHIALIASLC